MTTYIPSPSIAVIPSTEGPPVRIADARPTTVSSLRVAAFSCRGLEELSRALGFPVAVVAAVTDPDEHIRHLRDLWYASGIPMNYHEWPVPFDFDDWHYRAWRRVDMDERWFGRIPHALGNCVEDGSLLIQLPKGITKQRYATAFRDGLRDMRFEVVARRPSRCVWRHHRGRSIAVTSRYARASAVDPNPVEVKDLIAFSPRALPRVADVAFMTLVHLNATTSI